MIRKKSRLGVFFRRLLLAALAAWQLAPVAAQTPASSPGLLRLAEPARPAKEPTAVYLVELREAGAASYKGDTAGFAATKPAPGARLDRTDARVESYVKHLEDTHERLLDEIDAGAKLYSFRYAFNGFAARLDPAAAAKLARRPEVRRIWPDTIHRLRTNNSALFLGLLDQDGGLRADLNLRGENVVVGVIDSGIAPDHPALRDYEERIPRLCAGEWATGSWLGLFLCRGYRSDPPTELVYDPPVDFRGICQAGEGFDAADCNNKLIGARYYIDGFLSRYDLDEGEFISARDADGHGTHIATTVAGNSVTATLFGTRVATVSGIAPRARLAVYKACWLRPGDSRGSCATSDLARAIDDAVGDGVDIINYSVGSLETDLTAPEDLALLHALDAGVLSVVAAGNDGPSFGTIGSPGSAPWVLTVAASTQTGTRYEEAIEVTAPPDLAGQLDMREASFTPQLRERSAIEGELALVDDGEDVLADGGLGSIRDGCEALRNDGELNGSVALIERGGCTFEFKLTQVEEAGAVAAVVYNTTGAPIVMNGGQGSVSIPAVMIGAADGQDLVDALVAGDAVSVRLAEGTFVERRDTGNQMADFSSRGPALSEPDFVKPDVTAPGVNILAGASPDMAHGLSGEYFQYLSGTSMATPETAGIAALIKEARPDWSPGAIKSALMTTARQNVVAENGEFDAVAFEMGAGHIDANRTLDPGLVYDTGFLDHAAYLCGAGDPPYPADECDQLAQAGFPFAPEHLNLPSIGISEFITGDVVTRRVTNVGSAATYRASVEAPFGIQTTVDPSVLTLGSGESADFSVTFEDQGTAPFDFWQFGRLVWSDGQHTVGSPLAVQPVALRAPEEISLVGSSGSGVLPIDFAYDDDYVAGIHGLHEPGLHDSGFVADDTSNAYSFRFNDGVTAHYFDLSPGELFLRVALFDELTDGADDLDLYLYYCPTTDTCTQVGQSGGFTSDEQIDLTLPPPGLYAVLVHGFETDEVAGGPGAEYELFAWSFGSDDDRGNFRLATPATPVLAGDRLDFEFDWGPLEPNTRYVGAVAHDTPFNFFYLTIISVLSP